MMRLIIAAVLLLVPVAVRRRKPAVPQRRTWSSSSRSIRRSSSTSATRRRTTSLGTPVYTEARAFLQRPAAEALVRAHRALASHGYGLLISDGYRPWRVTKMFWDVTPPEKHEFVADPAKGSKHNRGCAVDLSMYDLTTGTRCRDAERLRRDVASAPIPTYAGRHAPRRATRRDLLRDGDGARGLLRRAERVVALQLQGLEGLRDPGHSVQRDQACDAVP